MLVYLLLCLLLGVIGRDRPFGLWGSFFLSILLTPLGGALVLLLVGPSRRTRQELS